VKSGRFSILEIYSGLGELQNYSDGGQYNETLIGRKDIHDLKWRPMIRNSYLSISNAIATVKTL